ncbi:MAG: hypothetical protein WCF67_25265 [Chitinophagaceae bacterium]
MKRILLICSCICGLMACNSDSTTISDVSTTPPVQLPFTASYTADWSDSVSDQDLLVVLNSYKYWQDNDMKALSGVMGDSVTFLSYSGFKYSGRKDSLMNMWTKSRDSMSGVTIIMDSWRKAHSTAKKGDFVSVWYKEIDTYKDGRVDSAYYQDNNMILNGKIVWYAQHKRVLK